MAESFRGVRGGVFGLSCVGVVYAPMLYRLPRTRGRAEARDRGWSYLLYAERRPGTGQCTLS